jgi:hypothetical protein
MNWLGRYARVGDYLAVKNVAQGAPLGAGSTLEVARRLRNFDNALGMIAWVHISTASESALTPTACSASSANPWTESI